MHTKIFLLWSCVALWFLLPGCSTDRRAQSHTAEAVNAAHELTTRRAVEGQQIPNVTVSGSSNVVTVAATPLRTENEVSDNANARGEASGEARSTFRASVSTWLGFAAALVALGVALVAYVVYRNFTAAGRASDAALAKVVSTGDAAISSVIQGLRNQLQGSTDPSIIAAHSPTIAALEAARGKLAGAPNT